MLVRCVPGSGGVDAVAELLGDAAGRWRLAPGARFLASATDLHERAPAPLEFTRQIPGNLFATRCLFDKP